MDLKQPKKSGAGGRLLQKMLMPIVATAASAAASYAAKKAPQLLDEKLGPKLREMLGGAGDAARDLPSEATSAASGAGDVAQHLGERAKSAAGGAVSSAGGAASSAGDAVHTPSSTNGRQQNAISEKELERHLEERKKARDQRRKALK